MKTTDCNQDAMAGFAPVSLLCRLRHLGEMIVCVCIITTMAVVTLTACLLLRPVGILIERSAAKERKRHNRLLSESHEIQKS